MAHGYDGSLMVSHRQPIGPCQVQQPWVTLKGRTSWVDVFICRILITLIWCDPECPNLARYYKRWRSVFLKGQPHSHSKGHGPSIPQISGTLPVRKWFDLQRQILVRQHTWGWVSRGHPGSGNECLLQAGAADYITTHSSASIQASQWLLLLFPNFHQQSNMHLQVYSATSMAAEVIYHLTSA